MVSIGYPGLALRDCVMSEPHNLAPGWVGFEFRSAFGRPVKLTNDAAMQALGSYQAGKLLFLVESRRGRWRPTTSRASARCSGRR